MRATSILSNTLPSRRSRSVSRIAHVTGTGDKSASGLPVKRPCPHCVRFEANVKQVIHSGLTVIRVRYGLPYCELPDCSVPELSRLLSFLLLQGKERDPVSFPRRQAGRGIDGLCRLQRLGRRQRWELAHSMASIKRNLPGGCRLHTPSARSRWEENALSQPPPPSLEFLDHVRRVSAQIFPPGWDRKYLSFVGSFLPNPSARKPLLSRADHLWSGRREEFFSGCTSETSGLEPVIHGRYKDIHSAGKCRPMLIPDERIDLLGPLHKCMYAHLRKFEWLLCGPPTEERMASVCANRVQTSVDLVNATDNLPHSVAEIILDNAFFSSEKIPLPLRRLAKASLKLRFEALDGSIKSVSHGQMMGTYLSFPLLCVQSYVGATWAAAFDPHAKFLVNGDDCVISAERGITAADYPSGYRLNSDKSILAEDVVEVNSTAFLRCRGKWREVRHLRRGGGASDYPGQLHIAEAVLKSGGAWVTAYQRARIGRHWGFLPSQLGHWTYPAYKREQGMSHRYFSVLPTTAWRQDETSLRRIYGRDPTDLEAESLRDLFWAEGRRVGLKRDVFSPSVGFVRRSYRYQTPHSYRDRFGRPFGRLSYRHWKPRRLTSVNEKSAQWFLLPEEFVTVEEERAEIRLEALRREVVSLALVSGKV